MTKNFYLLLFFFLPFYSFSQTYSANDYFNSPFPTVEEVHRYFYSNYSKSELGEDEVTAFQKNPDGWYIFIRNTSTGNYRDYYLIWSFKTKNYNTINLKKRSESEEQNVKINLSYVELYAFNANLFYGYKEWSEDVIKVLGNTDNLSDYFLNALARAYIKKTLDILHGSMPYDKNYDPSSFSKETIDDYLKYTNLSLSAYKKLYNQNPRYATIFGNIIGKYWTESMMAYMSLNVIQQGKLAEQFLKDDLYDDFFIMYAKNVLNSCEKNAILFVTGDMDTLPILYVQSKLNFRKDVTVMNFDLLRRSRYIYYHHRLLENNIKLTLNEQFYKEEVNENCVFLKNENEALSIEALFRSINNGELWGKDSSTVTFPVSDLIFKTSDNIASLGNYSSNKYIKSDAIMFHIDASSTEKKYLILLDIIFSNNWERPIYISSTFSSHEDIFLGLKDYLVYEGLNYRLIPALPVNKKDFPEAFINVQFSYNYFKNIFSEKGIDQDVYKFQGKEFVITLYRRMYAVLGDELLNSGENEKAIEMVDSCISKIPSNYAPFGEEGLGIAGVYYRAGKNEKGFKILKSLYESKKDKFDIIYNKYKGTLMEIYSQADQNEKEIIYIYNEMRDLSKEFLETRIQFFLDKHQFKKLYD